MLLYRGTTFFCFLVITIFLIAIGNYCFRGLNPFASVIYDTMSISSSTTSNFENIYSMAFVTVPNKELGEKLASGLINEKLAACVNIIPGLTSVYEWDGKVQKDDELLLMIKTKTSLIDSVSEYVRKNHSYDIPEVISAKIDNGNPLYLDWIGKVTK